MKLKLSQKYPVLLTAIFFPVLMSLSSCAGRSSVLVPIEKNNTGNDVNSVDSGSYKRLAEILASHQYQGVGLQYESSEMQEVLIKVFSDPRTANRKVRLIYTGLGMGYDAKFKSLTVGMDAAEAIIHFIQTKVPLR